MVLIVSIKTERKDKHDTQPSFDQEEHIKIAIAKIKSPPRKINPRTETKVEQNRSNILQTKQDKSPIPLKDKFGIKGKLGEKFSLCLSMV